MRWRVLSLIVALRALPAGTDIKRRDRALIALRHHFRILADARTCSYGSVCHATALEDLESRMDEPSSTQRSRIRSEGLSSGNGPKRRGRFVFWNVTGRRDLEYFQARIGASASQCDAGFHAQRRRRRHGCHVVLRGRTGADVNRCFIGLICHLRCIRLFAECASWRRHRPLAAAEH
jgi:hypothetical protein